MSATVSVSRFVNLLREGYTHNSDDYAAGVLHAARQVKRTLERTTHAPDLELAARLERTTNELLTRFIGHRHGFAHGVLGVVADLRSALETYVDPLVWGEVLDAPMWAGADWTLQAYTGVSVAMVDCDAKHESLAPP